MSVVCLVMHLCCSKIPCITQRSPKQASLYVETQQEQAKAPLSSPLSEKVNWRKVKEGKSGARQSIIIRLMELRLHWHTGTVTTAAAAAAA